MLRPFLFSIFCLLEHLQLSVNIIALNSQQKHLSVFIDADRAVVPTLGVRKGDNEFIMLVGIN